MANYLLLRSNKESGPYSLEDLVELGLKPYDLVWVQGKSAAWRYPSEIDELRQFAPAVEEQPFDRFFKRQSEEKKEQPFQEKTLKQEETITQPEIAVVAAEYEKYIPKKSVYVNMPGQKNTQAKQPIKESLPTAPIQPTISVSENPVTAQVKYSQPLDEIKEMYVKTLFDRKQRIARKGFWIQNLKKAGALLLLVAVGVMLGFMLKSNKTKDAAVAVQSTELPPQKSMPPISEKDSTVRVLNNNKIVIVPPTRDLPNKQLPESRLVGQKEFNEKMAAANLKKEPVLNPSENQDRNSLVAKSVGIDPITGERSRQVRNPNELTSNSNNPAKSTDRSVLPAELSGQVTVASNDYKKVAFGGIRDLQLTITNDSKYVLDNVVVELQYLKPSEQTLRSENIQFTSVGPKSTSTIKIPDTNRGIKVIYRIVSIKKRQDGDVAGK